MRRLFLLLLAVGSASCSCGEYASGRPAVAVVTAPLRLEFGAAWVGEPVSREVVVRNEGHRGAELRVDGVPDDVTVEPSLFTVPAAGEATIVVSFRPAAAGPRQVELALVRGGDRVEALLPVTGEGVEGALELPPSLDFGEAEVGGRTALQVVVKNHAPLAIPAPILRFEGPGAAAYTAMFPLGEIPAADEALLDLTFAPTFRGPAPATLSIAACATCAPATISLTGLGLDAHVVPVPAWLDFGVVSPGGFRTLEAILENQGDRAARITGAWVGSPAFRVEARSWPLAIEPGESAPVWITFEPQAIGTLESRAEFLGENGTYAAVTLTGHGGGAVLEVDEAVDLGRVPLGWSGFRTTVVRNVGEPMATQLLAARVEGGAAWTVDPVDGLEVGLFPGTLRLRFHGAAVGRADAELVLATTDPEQPELRIPLRAEVVSQPDCTLRAWPDPLRFGLVKSGLRHRRDLELESVGAGPCLVWDLRMAPGGDPDFAVPTGDAPFLEVPAGGIVRVPVQFAPDVVTGVLQRATVTWRTSNPATPAGAVDVTGLAGEVDLVALPNPVDFGRVPLDRAPHRAFRVQNRGALLATLTGHTFDPRSSPRFTVSSAPAYPTSLARGAEVTYEATYDPDEVERDRALVQVRVTGYAEPFLVDLRGEGHDGPCGDYCVPPVPVCPAPRTVVVNRPVAIDGSASDPQGDPVTCRWRVVSAPEGSTEQPSPPDTCATTFLPDAIGDYTLELTAADDLGNEASCLTRLHVQPPGGGLWVEMYWETYSNDIDLHLLHGGGGDPRRMSSWNDSRWDCHYANDPASWDAPGAADDANLDRDVTTGAGVENIRVDQPSTAHDYHVGLVWYSRHTSSPTTLPVVTNVYCWGLPVASVTTTMVHGSTPDRPTIFVGTVRFRSDGTCSWTPDGTAPR